MRKKIKQDLVLKAVQERTTFSYDTVKDVYETTGSYDATIALCELALKYNRDIIDLARLFRQVTQ